MQGKADMIPALPIVQDFNGSLIEIQEYQKAIHRPDFIYATTFRQQIGILCEHLHNNYIKVSYDRIGKIFNENRHCIRNQHERFLYGKRNGRPCKLTNEQIQLVTQKILSYHTNPGFALYPGFDDIEEFIFDNFNIQIKRDTLRHILNNKLGHLFKTVIGKPMDMNRIEANIDLIDINLNILSEIIEGVPTNFIFNIDEVGNHDYADAEIKTLIAPANYNQLYAHYPISRNGTRASLIAAISPTGIACIPQVAITRATLDDDIYDYIPLDSVQIVHTDNGYVNSGSFENWFKTIFLPELHRLREKYNYHDKAVVIMDGLKAHENLLENIDSEAENIVFHFLVAHSSDQTQPLDIGLFAIMKRYEQNYTKIQNLSQQTNQLIKILNCFYKAATPVNCKAAFKASGIISEIKIKEESKIEIAKFDLQKCTKVRHYQEAHIDQLIQLRKPLTINQQIIHSRSLGQNNQNRRSRSSISYFPNKRTNK